MNKNKGFSLIELMVTISIIAILSSIGIVVYSSSQKNARISKRIADLDSVRSALELYRVNNLSYPRTDNLPNNGGFRSECLQWVGVNANQVIPGLIPQYLQGFPSDPVSNKINTNCYIYNSNGTDYKFADYGVSELSNSDLSMHPNLIDPTQVDLGDCPNRTDANRKWAIYSPGAKCW